MKGKFNVNIIDSTGELHAIEFKQGEYANLMELIVNSIYEEIGDCRGRAWCGTCLVEEITTSYNELINIDEEEKLTELEVEPAFRLSCQLMLDQNLDNTTWRVEGQENF
jgi:2Fe-2S ferredoxin